MEKVNFDGGYLCSAPYTGGLCMVVCAEWGEEHINMVKESDVTCIRLSSSAGWREKDVSFLKDVGRHVLGIEIYSHRVSDLSVLNEINTLEFIALDVKKGLSYPDFRRFVNLRVCFLSGSFSNAMLLLECGKLENIKISGFPFIDLTPLSHLPIAELSIMDSSELVSLRGLRSNDKIEYIQLYKCPKLVDITEIASCSGLVAVNIESCKGIYMVPELSGLNDIQMFNISNCSAIKSLLGLKDCTTLESVGFSGDTCIEDGDLSFLDNVVNLKRIGFKDRKHYNRTLESIRVKIFIKT